MMKKRKIGVDGGPFNINESNSSLGSENRGDDVGGTSGVDGAAASYHRPNYDPFSLEYNMTGQRLLYIFNHSSWKDEIATGFRKLPKPRPGTENDVRRLQQSFETMNFFVDKPCDNFTNKEIEEKVEYICQLDHKNTSCVAIAILTHGNSDGLVYAADKPYLLSDVIDRLLLERKLAGVPKLFFIQVQACRGGQIDFGHQLQIDGTPRLKAVTVPTHSDSLVLRSAYTDYLSFRDAVKGSWMIQALCDVLDEHHRVQDILHMMMLVNNKVALRNIATNNANDDDIKQIPEVQFTLTKSLKF